MIWRALRGGTQLLRGFLITGRWGVRVEYGVRVAGPGKLDMSPGSILRHHARIFIGQGAILQLRSGASIGSHSIVNVASGVVIGEGSRISWRCQILDTDFHAVISKDGLTRRLSKAIEIGPNVLVGTGVIILKGAHVGADSVIGAGSVVTGGGGRIPAGSLVCGNPATVVAEIGGWIP